jgi:sulfur carrier protein ThiS
VLINVRVYGNWQLVLPGGQDRVQLSVAEGSSIQDLLKLIEVKDSNVVLIAVNGNQVDESYILLEQDKIEIFYPVEGG